MGAILRFIAQPNSWTFFITVFALSGTALAQESADPQHHSLVVPFPGSELISFEPGFIPPGDPELFVDEFPLLVRAAEHYGGISSNPNSTEVVDGIVTHATHRGPPAAGVFPIMRFHDKNLREAGFEVIFKCAMASCGGRNFTHAVVSASGGGESESKDFRYLVARRENTHVAFYVGMANVGGGPDMNRVIVRSTVIEPPGGSSDDPQPSNDDRGVVLVKTEDGGPVAIYKESHALLIGVSNYQHWPKLPGVVADLVAVRAALERQAFSVEVITDPNQRDLERAFEDFILRHGRDPGNRLLFYFAGHGYTHKPAYAKDNPEKWRGFIVSRDSPLPDGNFADFRRNAMSMQRFEELAKDIESNHAMFLLDSCFSGTLIAATREPPADIAERVARPVRQFITSGSADQAVPDVSIFRRQFVRALAGEADLTNDGYVTGTELGVFLTSNVTNYSSGSQTPRYGKLRDPDLDKGDFVFVVGDAVTQTRPDE